MLAIQSSPTKRFSWKTMLPCNVVVQELPDGRVEVAAIDPYAMIKALAHRPHTHERELLLGVEPSGAACGQPLLKGLFKCRSSCFGRNELRHDPRPIVARDDGC